MRGGVNGIHFLSNLNEKELTRTFAAVRTHNVPNDEMVEFIKVTDGYASQTVSSLLRNTGSGKRVAEAMKLDKINKQMLVKLAYTSDSEFVDENLQPRHVLKVARKYETKSTEDNIDGDDLRSTRVMALGENNVQWMEKQDIGHAIERHVSGDDMERKDTSFFPTGRTIKTGNGDHKLPDSGMPTLQAEAQLRNTLKQLAYIAIKNGDESGGKITYAGIQKYGISEIGLNIDGTHVVSIYPTKGTNVHKWKSDSETWVIKDSSTQSRTYIWSKRTRISTAA